MPKRKPGLSLERHKEIGKELKQMHNDISSLLVEVGNAYPISGKRGKALKHIQQISNSLIEARSELENLLFQDFPDDATTKFYYGGKQS
jgi:hypothetical protein